MKDLAWSCGFVAERIGTFLCTAQQNSLKSRVSHKTSLLNAADLGVFCFRKS